MKASLTTEVPASQKEALSSSTIKAKGTSLEKLVEIMVSQKSEPKQEDLLKVTPLVYIEDKKKIGAKGSRHTSTSEG